MTNKQLTAKIAAPYASALFNLAVSTSSIDIVTNDFRSLKKIFKENKNLIDYLRNPLYSKKSKKEILEKALEPQFASKNTSYLVKLLIDRSRIDLLEIIIDKYLDLVTNLAKIQIVKIKSAFELTSRQKSKLILALKERTSAKEIKLEESIDKSLLGGFQVQIDSNIIDFSLKSQLNQLATQLETKLF
jgi:F-type H+-transporting ATPase subunit delta